MSFARRGWGLRAGVLVLAAGAAGSLMAQPAAPSEAEQKAIDRARQALEGRHEWVDGLTVESIRETQWPDSSLGCRQPGVSYMQVITSGYTIRFTKNGNVSREVHVAGERTAVCRSLAREGLKTPGPHVPLHNLDEMIEKARADLAMRLGGAVDEVKLVNWLPLRLPARVLRCEVPVGSDAGGAVVAGYRIELAYKARNYTYQSDMQSVTACPRIEQK
jgi:hypothetical protein